MCPKYIFLLVITVIGVLSLITPSSVSACTYNSTITGNHLDIQVQNNDWPNLGVLEIISYSHTAIWTKMYQPQGVNWITTWEDLGNNMYFGLVGGSNGDTAYWGFNALTVTTTTIPYGVYGVDFIGTLSHQDYYVQMNHPEDFGSNYIVCTRNGEVIDQNSATPTKAIFVPGLGASWNADALINCKPNNYNGDWTLAPYAKEIYQPILDALTSAGWITKPFFYDWRKDVRDNATLLTDLISSNTVTDEKVDLIGHSMGGLLGRSYLESEGGGQLSKLLTIGSPYQGSALAYPIWSGGEIWNNNLIEKIAVTLYIKHCGGLFSNSREIVQSMVPSIQNLLSTVDYIRNSQTHSLKPVASMIAKTNYLPTNLITPFWGVKVGTLSGTGFPTLNIIDVSNPSKNDLRQGNWIDGKPIHKEFTNYGDGTVLTASSQIDGAINKTIIQSHSGLVASTEGITEILNFLGSPNSLEDPPFVEPTSALILIGYPGNFWISDTNGVSTQSDQGMIAIMDPRDMEYQLQIIPTSPNTTFFVAQFLPNSQTLFREYKFKGLNQEPKIIEFNSKHAQKNIMHEVKEYKAPRFPKFWFEFWKFFNKK